MSDDDALFSALDDGRYQATDLSRGPWDPRALHGGPVAALAARALEQVVAGASTDDTTFRPARLTVELERPVGFDPLRVTAELTRPGRSVRTAALDLHDAAGRRLARATLVAIRVRPEPLDLTGAVLPDDVAPPPPSAAGPAEPWMVHDQTAFHTDGVAHAFVAGAFDDLGPATDWIRLRVPVVADEEPSPLQRVAAAADFGNGMSAALAPATHTFINPDITITLHREAVGEAIGVAATTRVDPAGVGVAESVLWDERGRVGSAVQTLLVEAR